MTTNKLQYEIQENKGKHQENKEEIDSLINNESFFSDFEEEFYHKKGHQLVLIWY